MVDFMLRSLIHVDLSFMHGARYESIFIVLHVDIRIDPFILIKGSINQENITILNICTKFAIPNFILEKNHTSGIKYTD